MVSGVAIIIFYWSVKSGQYEDFEGEAHRILMEDEDQISNKTDNTSDKADDNNTTDQSKQNQ